MENQIDLIYYTRHMIKYVIKSLKEDSDFIPKKYRETIYKNNARELRLRRLLRIPCIVDRSSKYQFLFNTKAFNPMPPFVYDETVPDLETLMHERSQELVDTGIPIQFFWSGGIDSTAALLILLEHVPKDKLLIQLTPSSIDECPLLWDRLSKFNHDIHREHKLLSISKPLDYIVCDCGSADTFHQAWGHYPKQSLNKSTPRQKRFHYLRWRFGLAARNFRFIIDYRYDHIPHKNIMPFYSGYNIERYFINKLISGEITPFTKYRPKVARLELEETGGPSYLTKKMGLRNIIAKYNGLSEWAYNKGGYLSFRPNELNLLKLIEDKKNNPRNYVLPYQLWGVTSDGQCISSDNIHKFDPTQYINLKASK
jgi:hypothetical protein